jgi:hypothetical protein
MVIIKQEGGKIISGASMKDVPNILWLEEIRKEDIISIGGKEDLIANHKKKVAIPIGIFGAFKRYELLESFRDFLISDGYYARLSVNLEKLYPRRKNEDPDVYNFRISRKLIEESEINIFIIFLEHGEETNINQSVTQEAQYLYDLQQVRMQEKSSHVMILVEKGCKPAGLFRGMVKECHPRWKEASFSTRKEMFTTAKQFCANIFLRDR